VELLDHSLPGGGDLHESFRRVHLDQGLVELDVVSLGHTPRDDLGVLEALAQVGEEEFANGHHALSS
jgi:hypothetical protein